MVVHIDEIMPAGMTGEALFTAAFAELRQSGDHILQLGPRKYSMGRSWITIPEDLPMTLLGECGIGGYSNSVLEWDPVDSLRPERGIEILAPGVLMRDVHLFRGKLVARRPFLIDSCWIDQAPGNGVSIEDGCEGWRIYNTAVTGANQHGVVIAPESGLGWAAGLRVEACRRWGIIDLSRAGCTYVACLAESNGAAYSAQPRTYQVPQVPLTFVPEGAIWSRNFPGGSTFLNCYVEPDWGGTVHLSRNCIWLGRIGPHIPGLFGYDRLPDLNLSSVAPDDLPALAERLSAVSTQEGPLHVLGRGDEDATFREGAPSALDGGNLVGFHTSSLADRFTIDRAQRRPHLNLAPLTNERILVEFAGFSDVELRLAYEWFEPGHLELILGDNDPALSIQIRQPDGSTSYPAGWPRFPAGLSMGPGAGRRITSAPQAPAAGDWRPGDIVWNSRPAAQLPQSPRTPDAVLGWICVRIDPPEFLSFGRIELPRP